MTYTKNDLVITSESVPLIVDGATNGSVEKTGVVRYQSDFYMGIEGQKFSKIQNFSVTYNNKEVEGADFAGLFSATVDYPASPCFITSTTINGVKCIANFYMWPIAYTDMSVPVSLHYLQYRGDGKYATVPYGEVFFVDVKASGQAQLTIVYQPVSYMADASDVAWAENMPYMSFLYPTQPSYGHERLGFTFDKKQDGKFFPVEANSSSFIFTEVESEDETQYEIEPAKNYYVSLNNGKKIKSFTVNQECHLSDLNAALAQPFSVNKFEGFINNAFLWPMGDAQQVRVSMYTTSASLGGTAYSYGDSYSLDVNQYPGSICASLLTQESAEYIYDGTNDVYAYIDFEDEDGEKGSCILGPAIVNGVAGMKLYDWKEVFGSINNMTFEFPQQYGATTAQIYANGRNQVPVRYSLSVLDKNYVSIPLTEVEVEEVSYLVNNLGNLINNGQNTGINNDGLNWHYTYEAGDFVNATYNTQSGSTRAAPTVYSTGRTAYVSCDRKHQSAITLAYAVNINGTVYSTSSDNANYIPVILLDVFAAEEKLLQYRGGNGPNSSDADSDFNFTKDSVQSSSAGGSKADYWNYYISFNNGEPITKADIKPEALSEPVLYPYMGAKYPLPWSTAVTLSNGANKVENAYAWELGEKRSVTVLACRDLNGPEPATTLGWQINVCEKGAGQLCLTEINFNTMTNYSNTTQSQNRYVELYDRWGNSGVIGLRHMNESGKGDLQITNGYAATITNENINYY